MILYSTGCPKCQVLKKKLDLAGLDYETVTDVDIMKEKGIVSVPVLEVEPGKLLSFIDAVEWVAGEEQ